MSLVVSQIYILDWSAADADNYSLSGKTEVERKALARILDFHDNTKSLWDVRLMLCTFASGKACLV